MDLDFLFEENRIYAEDKTGKLLAEITFPKAETGVVEIDHTFVDDSLRGQGIAGQLMEMAVSLLRMRGDKARPTCPYAVSWFEKHPEQQEGMLR